MFKENTVGFEGPLSASVGETLAAPCALVGAGFAPGVLIVKVSYFLPLMSLVGFQKGSAAPLRSFSVEEGVGGIPAEGVVTVTLRMLDYEHLRKIRIGTIFTCFFKILLDVSAGSPLTVFPTPQFGTDLLSHAGYSVVGTTVYATLN